MDEDKKLNDDVVINKMAEDIVNSITTKYKEIDPAIVLLLIQLAIEILKAIFASLDNGNATVRWVKRFPIVTAIIVRLVSRKLVKNAKPEVKKYTSDLVDLILERVLNANL